MPAAALIVVVIRMCDKALMFAGTGDEALMFAGMCDEALMFAGTCDEAVAGMG